MATNNALNLSAQGVPYYNGAGTFTTPTITQRAPLIGDASNNVKTTSAMTNGQILIGSTGADPVPAVLGGGQGVTITTGAGTATVSIGTESTWTPSLSGATTAGVGTYTTQAGISVRFGNMIYIAADIVWTAHTGTGNLLLTGLPFTVRNTATFFPLGMMIPINVSTPGGIVSINMVFTQNTTQATFSGSRNNNTANPFQIEAAGELQLSGWYLI